MGRIIIFSAIFLLSSLFTKESHLTVIVDQMVSNIQSAVMNLQELRSDISVQDTIDKANKLGAAPKKGLPQRKELTAMDALDIIKGQYAANFEKVGITEDTYYYQLEDTGYYLAYEEEMEARTDYLIHLYEFVEDEPVSGIGHTVTYGWYRVDRETGRITEMLQY